MFDKELSNKTLGQKVDFVLNVLCNVEKNMKIVNELEIKQGVKSDLERKQNVLKLGEISMLFDIIFDDYHMNYSSQIQTLIDYITIKVGMLLNIQPEKIKQIKPNDKDMVLKLNKLIKNELDECFKRTFGIQIK